MTFVRDSVPRPSDGQVRAFVGFLSSDHSWYKKLPMTPPGEPFFLYLNPHEHQAWVERVGNPPRAWRSIIRNEYSTWLGDQYVLDLQEGDLDPDIVPSVTHYARRLTTAQRREALSCWSYWNFGPPGQPRADAIRMASNDLTVSDDDGRALTIPADLLDAGLVYLRATISGYLGPRERDYEEARAEHRLPPHGEDRAIQIEEMVAAMQRVVLAIYGP